MIIVSNSRLREKIQHEKGDEIIVEIRESSEYEDTPTTALLENQRIEK
jgi:hypothetical protein